MNKPYSPPQGYATGARPPIALSPVASTQIAGIGYDADTLTLAVQFKFGAQAIYHYPSVVPQMHEAFMKAESKGKFFKEHIKPLAFSKYPAPAAAPSSAPAATAATA